MDYNKYDSRVAIVGIICVMIFLSVMIICTSCETNVKERTNQLELEKEILLLEKEKGEKRCNAQRRRKVNRLRKQ